MRNGEDLHDEARREAFEGFMKELQDWYQGLKKNKRRNALEEHVVDWIDTQVRDALLTGHQKWKALSEIEILKIKMSENGKHIQPDSITENRI